ncbi:MAG: DUF502 domain-containing protein, partial [Arcobacter sp.]|nr:DUF502 domain-containing protein [Arcobacter sp.]
MKQFFRYILVGGLALIPLFVVVQIIMWGENIVEGVLDSLFIYTNNTFISLGAIIVIILFLAFIGSSIEKVGKSLLVHFIDTALEKLPAIGTIYGMVKKIT